MAALGAGAGILARVLGLATWSVVAAGALSSLLAMLAQQTIP